MPSKTCGICGETVYAHPLLDTVCDCGGTWLERDPHATIPKPWVPTDREMLGEILRQVTRIRGGG